MKIICDSCGTKYSISDDKVRGKVFKIRCKKCSHIIVVRGGEVQASSSVGTAAAPAAEGGWHVVVDGEQVGPIPETDVRERIERGELKADSYVWKEGFADWLKLSTVPEFSALVAPAAEANGATVADGVVAAIAQPGTNGTDRTRRPSGARKSLFGGGGDVDIDADAFGAPAAAARGGGDLFASPAAHAPASDEPRWPTSGAAVAGHDGGRVESLTAQRHENSVLFSLSNLQSLAMPSPKPASSGSTSGATPVSEGSGLIDIRAMAATTLPGLSDRSSGGFGGGGDNDLPAFGAFSPAAPVLLPLPSSSGAPKWIYPVILLMVAAVGGIGFLAWKVINARNPLAPPEPTATVAAPAGEPAAKPSAPVAAKAGAKAGEEGAKKSPGIPDEKLPPRADGKGDGKSAEAKSEGKGDHRHGKAGKESKKGASSADEKKGVGVAATQVASADSGEKKPAKGSLDDLLEGAVKRPSGGARGDDASRRGGGASSDAPSAPPLAKSAVVAGMKGVQAKVADCYNQYKVPGMAMVNVVIAKSGKVASASVTGKFAGTPSGACVEKAVKSASFPPSSDGLSTPYPFQLK